VAAASAVAILAAPAVTRNPLDKLALGDADGVSPATAPASAAAAASAPAHATAPAPAKARDPHGKSSTTAHPGATPARHAAVTPAHKPRREDDADTELVAALIARMDHGGTQPGQLLSTSPLQVTAANAAPLARHCADDPDATAARQCRERVCRHLWGRVDACPAALAPARTAESSGAERAGRD
jgi:hypothetical protein